MADAYQQALRKLLRHRQAARAEQKGKFFAADARDDVGVAHRAAAGMRDLLEHLVPAQMAEAVVDGLEVVDIDDGQRKRRPMRFRLLDFRMQRLHEVAAVVQLGQMVAVNEFMQPRMRLVEFAHQSERDVRHHRGDHRRGEQGDDPGRSCHAPVQHPVGHAGGDAGRNGNRQQRHEEDCQPNTVAMEAGFEHGRMMPGKWRHCPSFPGPWECRCQGGRA